MIKGIKFKSIISLALAAILVFGLAATGFAAPPQTEGETQDVAQAAVEAPAEAGETDINIQPPATAGEETSNPVPPEQTEEPVAPAVPEVAEEEPVAAMAQEPVAGVAATPYELKGQVFFRSNGSISTGIANANVQLQATGGGSVVNTTTDSNGNYTLNVPDAGTAYNLVAAATKYKTQSKPVQINASGNPVTNFDIELPPQNLVGNVTFSPTLSTTATISLVPSPTGTAMSQQISSSGRFEFVQPENGTYKVQVAADGYKTVLSGDVIVQPDPNDIVLPAPLAVQGVKVSGKIVDDDNPAQEVAGVSVVLKKQGGETYTTLSKTDGTYVFDNAMKAGLYDLSIDHQGYSGYNQTNISVNNGVVGTAISDITIPDIALQRVFIRATVKKVTVGNPSGINTDKLDLFELYNAGGVLSMSQSSPIGTSGQYYMGTDTRNKKLIVDGSYVAKAKLDTYITAKMPVDIQKTGVNNTRPTYLLPKDIDATLQPMTVSGQLRSGSFSTGGKIPTDTPVRLIDASSGNEAMLTRTDSSGNFKFEYVKNGTYYAKVEVDGYVIYNGPQFTVQYEESAKNLYEITLDPTTISGKVTDKNQNPITGAQLTLYKTSDINANNLIPVTYPGLVNPITVGSDGSYEFKTVPNCVDYTIIARKNATHWENSINGILMINTNSTTGHKTGNTIIMRPILDGFEVHGKVFNENNVLMPGAYVRIFDKYGDQVGKAVQTGSNGVYSFEKIQPDTGYVVKAANRGYALGKQTVSVVDKDVTVGDIKMTRQTPVYFKGAVMDTSNANKGVAGLTVKIFAKNSDKELATAITDAAGKYTFTFSTPTTQLYIGAPYIIETQYKAISGKMYATSKLNFDYMGWDEEDLNIKITPQDAIFRISGRASLNTMNGAPVPFDGAKVRLENAYYGTMGEAVTAMDGTYNLYDLPAGLYNVYVSKAGYLKSEKKVETVQITDRDIMALDFVVTMQNAVSIGFDKEQYYVGVGNTMQLGFAVQPPEAGLDNVVFVSSNPAIATVDNNGRVRGVAAGETEITARVNDSTGIASTCKVKVVKSATGVEISNETKNMFVGSRIQLTASVVPKDATLQGITWKSHNTARVTIDSGGYMRGISRGRALITATSEDGLAVAECIVTVKQPVTQIKLTRSANTVRSGSRVQIHSQVLPSNANNKALTYTSKNTKVATVDKDGRVKGVAPGKTDIVVRAADGSETYTVFSITVKAEVRSVAFSQDSMRLAKGMRRSMNYVVYTSGGKIMPQFSSSNPAVVQVDASGKLYANNVGEAIITASATGTTGTKSATMRVYVDSKPLPMQSVSISGAPNTIMVGSSTWLSVNFNPVNATDNKVYWKSSNSAVLSINKDGKINAKKAGTVMITATAGGVSTSATITVKK